mgnify:FL=1
MRMVVGHTGQAGVSVLCHVDFIAINSDTEYVYMSSRGSTVLVIVVNGSNVQVRVRHNTNIAYCKSSAGSHPRLESAACR